MFAVRETSVLTSRRLGLPVWCRSADRKQQADGEKRVKSSQTGTETSALVEATGRAARVR